MILLVVSGKFLAHQFLFQPIGNPAAVELILQLPIAFVIHDALSHGRTSSALIYPGVRGPGQIPSKHSTYATHAAS